MSCRMCCRSVVVVSASLVLLGFAPMGEKKAVVKDAWGQEVTVQGYDDAKLPGGRWYVHDPERPQPQRAKDADVKPNLGAKPPEGAMVLFDGTDVKSWTDGEWKVIDDFMEVGKGNIRTKDEFGSCRLHIEWAAPTEVKREGQGRGNSGVFLMGIYEVQVLDSWKNSTYADGMAASLYGQSPPAFNVAVEPGEWNSYDIEFHAPAFDAAGKVTRPARITVKWNGVTVQDDVEILGATAHRSLATYHAHGPYGPIVLQDHGDPVRFRNIWVELLTN